LQIEDARAANITIIEGIARRIASEAAAGGEIGVPRQLTNGQSEDLPVAIAELVRQK
jgi:hypothetical protein